MSVTYFVVVPFDRLNNYGVTERRLLRILRRCGRILLLTRSRIRLLGLFIREVMANRTAADGPEDPVVAGIVPSNAARQGAFQTTLGLCGTRRKHRGQREGERDGGHDCRFHGGSFAAGRFARPHIRRRRELQVYATLNAL
jgi:hypothetical protein